VGLLYPWIWSDVVFEIRLQIYRKDQARVRLLCQRPGDSVESIVDDPTEGLSSAKIIHLFGMPDRIERFQWKITRRPDGVENTKIYLLANEKNADGEDWCYHNSRICVTVTKPGKVLFTDVF
jgi:hypothetical protein